MLRSECGNRALKHCIKLIPEMKNYKERGKGGRRRRREPVQWQANGTSWRGTHCTGCRGGHEGCGPGWCRAPGVGAPPSQPCEVKGWRWGPPRTWWHGYGCRRCQSPAAGWCPQPWPTPYPSRPPGAHWSPVTSPSTVCGPGRGGQTGRWGQDANHWLHHNSEIHQGWYIHSLGTRSLSYNSVPGSGLGDAGDRTQWWPSQAWPCPHKVQR